MRSTDTTGRHWDGTPISHRHRRTLTVAHDSPSRLLRTAQPSHCKDCGNRIDWHTTSSRHPIALHPTEVPAVLVPTDRRWHLASGVAHPSGDGTPWCRLPHHPLCPTHSEAGALPPTLDQIRRRLALNTRRLTDAGLLTPESRPTPQPQERDSCTPARPVVQLLYGRYIAAAPIDDIQCVAQTARRNRCAHPVLAPGAPPGRWTLLPCTTAPHRRGTRQLALPATGIAVYDLGNLHYSEQLRWRTQRCPTHAASTAAPDLALAEWEPLDPLRHQKFLATRLPRTSNSHS
ncbi:DUF6083 domain-containing protein [Streptomyces sp. NPDC051079]|uniref:DUF6083 domain-containing protein n=1 Tax=Streptomyces sp. NPDC051079 TaxID=3155043 RepID=UPI00344C3E6B